MSSTIFCTFDQQDLADLAMGQVRRIPGVIHVNYASIRPQSTAGAVNYAGVWGDIAAGGMSAPPVPSPPAGLRISCDKGSRKQVESVLINMHAYRIVSTS